MKLKTKLLIALLVLMLVPTFVFAVERTDGANFKLDVPETYSDQGNYSYVKDTGENINVIATEPLENEKVELTEAEFNEVARQVTESISGKEGYVVLSSDTKTVTVTKNNYKAYLLTYKLTYQEIEMNIKQYYFLTKEKLVLYTETRFTEEQFETEESKSMLDSFTLLNCTPIYGDNNSLISSNEPEDKSSALISSNEPEEKSTALISENEKDEKSSALISENPATNPVVPIAIIVVAVVALLIIKKVTSKKPDKDDNSNL